jgi:DNA-binding MarR family transcriptional regulator
MPKHNPAIGFYLDIAKFQAELSRRLDARLNGISLNEFIILYHLGEADKQTMRRIDLAEKVGLTASGITRLLLPMEKIGLVKKEADQHDARVSHVMLAAGGRTKLEEGRERLEIFHEEIAPKNKTEEIKKCSALLREMGKNMRS